MKVIHLRLLCCLLAVLMLMASVGCGAGNGTTGETTGDGSSQTTLEGNGAQPKPDQRPAQVEELKGLNVLAIGDDLFFGGHLNPAQQWLCLLREECAWNYSNLAGNGWTVAHNPDVSTAPSMVEHLLNDTGYAYGSNQYFNRGITFNKSKFDVNLILLEGAMNDFAAGIPLGEVDSTDTKTFYGAWNVMIEELLATYPFANILLVSSWHQNAIRESDGAKEADFAVTALKNIKQMNYPDNVRVGFLDAGNSDVTGLKMQDASFRKIYAKDGNHRYFLNGDGMKLMAKNILSALWKEGVDVPSTVETMERAVMAEQLKGLNVLAIGDSIFTSYIYGKEHQWIYQLAQECSWNYTGLGMGGWTVAYNPDVYEEGETARGSMYENLFQYPNEYCFGSSKYVNFGFTSDKSPEEVDLILMQGGVNDFQVDIPLGTVDSRDHKELLGAWNLMIDELLVRYPTATIGVITSWHVEETRQSDNASRVDFAANGVKELVATNYQDNERVFLIDAGDPYVSSVRLHDQFFRIQYAASDGDTNHLNKNGVKLMKKQMLPLLWQQLCSNDTVEQMQQDLQGLNVLALGDGWSADQEFIASDVQWINRLGRQCDWNLTNLSVAGMTISMPKNSTAPSLYDYLVNQKQQRQFVWGSNNRQYYTVGTPTGRAEDLDLILIGGGVYDAMVAEVGAWSQKTPITLIGAYRLILDELLKSYPKAKILLTTPCEYAGGSNPLYTQNISAMYDEILKDDVYSERIVLVDSGKPYVSGVDILKAKYSDDGKHLNKKGMAVMAHSMLSHIWKLFAWEERSAEWKSDLNGLNVLAIGDSLFDGDFLSNDRQWIGILAKQCKWNLTNLGRDGWTVAYNPDVSERSSMIDYMLNQQTYTYGNSDYYIYGQTADKTNADVDLILLEGGTNDYGMGIPLGSVDSTDIGTLYGAFNVMIDRLLQDYPNATVVLVTSWHIRESYMGQQRMDFAANALKRIKTTNYPVNERVVLLDAGNPKVSGILMSNAEFRAMYAKIPNDFNHLNAKGMRIMADSMLQHIWKLVQKIEK